MSCDPASRRPWQVHRVDGITRLDARGLWDVCFRGPLPWEEAEHAEALAAQFRGEDQTDALTDLVIEAVVGVVTHGGGEHRGDGESQHRSIVAAGSDIAPAPISASRWTPIHVRQRESLDATSMTARPASSRATGTRNGLADT